MECEGGRGSGLTLGWWIDWRKGWFVDGMDFLNLAPLTEEISDIGVFGWRRTG